MDSLALTVFGHLTLAVPLGLPIALIQEYRTMSDRQLELMHSWLDLPSITRGADDTVGHDVGLAVVFELVVLCVYTVSGVVTIGHVVLFMGFVALLSGAEQVYYSEKQKRSLPTPRGV